MISKRERIVFVTGRLAESALRREVDRLAEAHGFEAEVAVLPITVAALMTPAWIAGRLAPPAGTDRVIVPGYCRGDLEPIAARTSARVERGPADLHDLPGHFGGRRERGPDYGAYSIEILAEINHAPSLTIDQLIAEAERYRAQGADVIDLGMTPGASWTEVAVAVRELVSRGFRVSIDSFDPTEVERALSAGAELVLSVNSTNCARAKDWGAEVVAIPDAPGSLDGLDATIAELASDGVRFRIDPILEPIGFGFARSLGRYLNVRERYPETAVLMGVGNITELTDADSSGINTLLAGFCEELGIRSVLTTSVIPWARTSVRELDLARRLVHHAVRQGVIPKHLEPALVTLRDPNPARLGESEIAELALLIRDPNWRILLSESKIHMISRGKHCSGVDPYVLFRESGVVDPGHAFYLGRELMKAKTALVLGKRYVQDEALDWGFLTEREVSHRDRRARADRDPAAESEPLS